MKKCKYDLCLLHEMAHLRHGFDYTKLVAYIHLLQSMVVQNVGGICSIS